MRVFELIGPIMFGPSSSHTAGACRLSRAMWQIAGGKINKAELDLHGSFRAHEGGSVNKALVAGLLGFVGLIVPHIMRRIVGEESRRLVFSCALGGAALVALCDTLARVLFAPYELPVGIVLSFAGVPFFLWLLLRQRGGRIHD